MKKRGLSGVIVTILLILLAVIIIGIFWMVLRGTIIKTSSKIGVYCLTCDLKIEKVRVYDDVLNVTVTRNPGEGNLSGIMFRFLNDSKVTNRNRETNLRELETRTFSFDDVNNNVFKVEIAPVISNNGEKIICSIIDSENVEGFVGNGEECTPDCESEGKECGEDRCGGSCGSCLQGFNCVNGVCEEEIIAEKIYLPNSTGGNAWKGSDSAVASSAPDTLEFDGINTTYDFSELNEISGEDEGYIAQGAGSEFEKGAGHRILFDITESKDVIRSINIRALGWDDSLTHFNLYAWNYSSGNWGNALSYWIDPHFSPGNATAEIDSVNDYIDGSGNLNILIYGGDDAGANVYLYYAEAKVTYVL